MFAILISTIAFIIFLALGNLLMFINASCYWLIPAYFIAIILLQMFYKQPNCHSLELRDFVFTTILTLLFSIYLLFKNREVSFQEFWYLYLNTFIALVLFANSRRFKSLM